VAECPLCGHEPHPGQPNGKCDLKCPTCVKEQGRFPIPEGWVCVRCEGKHEYCVDCGSIRCVCPMGNRGARVVCEHDRDALKKIPTTCCKLRRKIVLGIVTVLPDEICGISEADMADVLLFDETSPGGKPIIFVPYCAWCGAKRIPGESESRVTEAVEEPDDDDDD